MRDRAAAGADLHHLDHRNPQRQTGAFAEAADPRDLEARAVCGLQSSIRQIFAVVPPMSNDSTLSRPHCRAMVAEKIAPPAGPLSTRRIGKRQAVSIVVRPPPDIIRNTGAGDADAAQPARQLAQIARHQRLHVGVGDRGGEALPLAHLRRDLAGQRDRDVRQFLGEDVAHAAFVRGIDEGVQEADGDAFDALALQRGHQGAHGGVVERQQHVALVVQPLRDRQAQMARHQRLGQDDVEVVLVVTAFVAHRDDVAKALGRQQRGARALALDHRVGGERGAVDHDADVGGRDARGLEDVAHARHHALFRRGWRGQHLGREAPAVVLERKVGEGAADVDGKSSRRHPVLGTMGRTGSEPVRPRGGKDRSGGIHRSGAVTHSRGQGRGSAIAPLPTDNDGSEQ